MYILVLGFDVEIIDIAKFNELNLSFFDDSFYEHNLKSCLNSTTMHPFKLVVKSNFNKFNLF